MLMPSKSPNPFPANRISGLKKAVQGFKPGICTERALIWTKYFKNPENKIKPVCIQIAQAFSSVLINKTIKIYPDELIVGNFTSKRVGGEILPELLGVPVMEDLFKFSGRKTSPLQVSLRETWQLLRILPFWMFRFLAMRAYSSPFTKVRKMLSQLKSYFYVMNETGGIAHTIPDHEKLIRVGTDGIIAEVNEKQTQAAKIDQPELLLKSCYAFTGFSLMASAVYIFNDLHDVSEDRLHPIKKFRPVAASEISPITAKALFLFLLFLGGGVMYFPFKNPLILGLVLFYILQNILYTLKLKHIAIVDTIIISFGFLIRILIGGIVTETILSQWIILMTFLLAMFLALAKRRDDVLIFIKTNEKPRKNVDGYNLEFLNATMMITASVVIVTYIMYTMSVGQTGMTDNGKNLYFTTFFVLIGIIRFLHLIMVKKRIGGPTKILVNDPFLLIIIFGWLITFAVLLY